MTVRFVSACDNRAWNFCLRRLGFHLSWGTLRMSLWLCLWLWSRGGRCCSVDLRLLFAGFIRGHLNLISFLQFWLDALTLGKCPATVAFCINVTSTNEKSSTISVGLGFIIGIVLDCC